MVVVEVRGRPLEQAQVLWQRALQFVDLREGREPIVGVMEMLLAAQHDSTTLAHALALGRTQRREADTLRVDDAVRILQRAVTFLGVRPVDHAAATSGEHHGA